MIAIRGVEIRDGGGWTRRWIVVCDSTIVYKEKSTFENKGLYDPTSADDDVAAGNTTIQGVGTVTKARRE